MDTETTTSSQKPVKLIGVILAGFDQADSPALRFLLLHMNTLQKTFEYEFLPAYEEFELIKLLSTQKSVDREKAKALAVPFIEEYEALFEVDKTL